MRIGRLIMVLAVVGLAALAWMVLGTSGAGVAVTEVGKIGNPDDVGTGEEIQAKEAVLRQAVDAGDASEARPSTAAPTGGSTLTGVISDRSGTPIEDLDLELAKVWERGRLCVSGPGACAGVPGKTTAGGSYRFTGLANGHYELSVRLGPNGQARRFDVLLDRAEVRKDLVLDLSRKRDIIVRTFARDEPVAVESLTLDPGGLPLEPHGANEYRTSIPWELVAFRLTGNRGEGTVEVVERRLRTCLPTVVYEMRFGQASALVVEIGEVAQPPSGKRVALALISFEDAGRELSAPIEDGIARFESVPVGRYYLSLRNSTAECVDPKTAVLAIRPGRDERVSVRAVKGGVVRGRVNFASAGRPKGGLRVALIGIDVAGVSDKYRGGYPGAVMQRSQAYVDDIRVVPTKQAVPRSAIVETVCDEGGAFSFDAVPAGLYRVVAGGDQVAGVPMDLDVVACETAVVELKTAFGCIVEGVAGDVFAVALRDEARQREFAVGVVAGAGFSLGTVPRGDYEVSVQDITGAWHVLERLSTGTRSYVFLDARTQGRRTLRVRWDYRDSGNYTVAWMGEERRFRDGSAEFRCFTEQPGERFFSVKGPQVAYRVRAESWEHLPGESVARLALPTAGLSIKTAQKLTDLSVHARARFDRRRRPQSSASIRTRSYATGTVLDVFEGTASVRARIGDTAEWRIDCPVVAGQTTTVELMPDERLLPLEVHVDAGAAGAVDELVCTAQYRQGRSKVVVAGRVADGKCVLFLPAGARGFLILGARMNDDYGRLVTEEQIDVTEFDMGARRPRAVTFALDMTKLPAKNARRRISRSPRRGR